VRRRRALPEDRKRHDELKQLAGNRLCVDPNKSTIMGAEFRNIGKTWERSGGMPSITVVFSEDI
jgi:hypothetical protein